ncbi:unnamed protein product, partial [Ectocarpus sp. 4 AP-2014]
PCPRRRIGGVGPRTDRTKLLEGLSLELCRFKVVVCFGNTRIEYWIPRRASFVAAAGCPTGRATFACALRMFENRKHRTPTRTR